MIKKEYCPSAGICCVRTDTYGHTLDFFQNLFKAARLDFPELKAEQVTIARFAGPRCAGTYGIEFKVTGQVPSCYNGVNNLEDVF